MGACGDVYAPSPRGSKSLISRGVYTMARTHTPKTPQSPTATAPLIGEPYGMRLISYASPTRGGVIAKQ